MPNVSTAKGKKGQKKPAQKHQNSFAYTVNKHSFVAQKIAALPVSENLCPRCVEIVQWKKRMNKYKPLTQPKKCVKCDRKSIKDAYHVICAACSSAESVCAKCREPSESWKNAAGEEGEMEKDEDEEIVEQVEEEELRKMSERQRRSFLRKREAGDFEGARRILEKARDLGDEEDEDDFSDFE